MSAPILLFDIAKGIPSDITGLDYVTAAISAYQ